MLSSEWPSEVRAECMILRVAFVEVTEFVWGVRGLRGLESSRKRSLTPVGKAGYSVLLDVRSRALMIWILVTERWGVLEQF